MSHTSAEGARDPRIGAAPPRGRDLEIALSREIGEADLVLLGLTESAVPASGIKRLRDQHHALARALSAGMTNVEASAVTGYTPSWISSLRKDPAFRELLTFYHENIALVQRDLHERLVSLSLDFQAELQDRIENDAKGMSNKFVLEALVALADRTGHAPIARSVNVNVDMAERLGAARRRAGLIEGTARPLMEAEPVS